MVTGGGSLLKNLQALIEYKTGLYTRIGYPNEHLAKGMIEEVNSPMYATAVGLVMNAIEDYERANRGKEVLVMPETKDTKKTKTKKDKARSGKGLFDIIKNWMGVDIEEFKD